MTFYYEFDDQRRHAEVYWPENATHLTVEIADSELTREFPADLIFEVHGNKVSFIEEDTSNKRLTNLQKTICRKLQEHANKMGSV